MKEMAEKTVKDLMVPLSDHMAVTKNATLHEVVQAVQEDSRGRAVYDRTRDILVVDTAGEAVGLICDLDILRGLEPGYKNIGDFRTVSLSGMSGRFIKDMLNRFDLWQAPLSSICEKASRIHVSEIDYAVLSDHHVTEDADLNLAAHLMVTGEHTSLFVKDAEGREVVGILHRRDLLEEVFERIKACKIQ